MVGSNFTVTGLFLHNNYKQRTVTVFCNALEVKESAPWFTKHHSSHYFNLNPEGKSISYLGYLSLAPLIFRCLVDTVVGITRSQNYL